MKPRQVFVREATGLVREFSWFDAFNISAAIILPSLWSYSSQVAFLTSATPGADWVMSEHLGLLFMIPLAITYILMSRSMPRSGGDYVWVSRLLHPAIGFMSGWLFWFAVLTALAVNVFINSSVIIPLFLASIGYGLGNSSLVGLASAVTAPTTVYILGLVWIAVGAVIAGIGPKYFSRAMLVLFALIALSMVLSFAVFATSSHADFVNAVNGYGGSNMTYDGIINQAKSGGWSYSPLSTSATLYSIPLSILLFTGMNYSAAASGEIKNVRSSMGYAILGSLLFAWLMNVIGTQLSVNVVGYEFAQASLSLGSNWPLVAPPWIPTFVSMLIRNPLLLILIQLGWLLTFLWWNGSGFVVVTRYVFAFSFDRVLPAKLADVNDRFHTPVNATALNFVLCAIMLAVATFTPFVGLYENTVAMCAIVWFLGSVAAILLPYKNKELASILPGSKWRVPAITIAGIVSMITMAITFYFSVTNPLVGPSTPMAGAVLVTTIVTGLAVYGVSYLLNKRRGIDLALISSQIPPE